MAREVAKNKHCRPGNVFLQQLHRDVMKEYTKVCRQKKESFWKDEYEKINMLAADNFGKIGKKWARTKSTPNHIDLEGKRCEEHFKALFTKIDADIEKVLCKVSHPSNEYLNREFTLEELKIVIKTLINKKAVGPDSIPNEFIKAAPPELLNLLLKYLNLNLKRGMTCSSWCLDLLTLIHKDGAKDDPNNYRGICIMNALLKILCTLLNNRLVTFCDDRQLINKVQIGFKKLCRASDHIFTLKAVVNKYVTDTNVRGKKLYTCFVDFQKAFDSVWHEVLFRKLENNKLNGNFASLLRNIYKSTKCAVKINGKSTQFFK